MRKIYIPLVLLTMLMFTGCDFFRILAGRPVSEEIEAKRKQIALAQQETVDRPDEAPSDTLADKVESEVLSSVTSDEVENAVLTIEVDPEVAQRDSLAAEAYLKENKVTILSPSRLKGVRDVVLDSRYYIVVGSFKSETNADKLIRKIDKEGDFSPMKIPFRNGMIAVGLVPCNKVQDAVDGLKDVKNTSFCPADAWILKND